MINFDDFFEDNFRGRPATAIENRYLKRNNTREKEYWDFINLYRTTMCQLLPTGNLVGIEVNERIEDNSNKSNLDTKGDHKQARFIECDLGCPQNYKKIKKFFPFSPGKKIFKIKIVSEYMKEEKPENNEYNEKMIMNQTNEQKYLKKYREKKLF